MPERRKSSTWSKLAQELDRYLTAQTRAHIGRLPVAYEVSAPGVASMLRAAEVKNLSQLIADIGCGRQVGRDIMSGERVNPGHLVRLAELAEHRLALVPSSQVVAAVGGDFEILNPCYWIGRYATN